jgi:predicted small lipoprotein YifL
MNKIAAMMMVLALAGCTRREPLAPPPPPAPKVDNAGDAIAKDIHDKLDTASAAGKAVEQAGADQAEKIKAATDK